MGERATPVVVGRYILHAPIARGGMATIHLARLLGAEGFSRMVAVKRLHPQFAEDPDFLAMFLDEARIASKVHHPNVVPVLDVVHTGAEVLLVQEYVHGLPLDKLLRAARDAHVVLPVGVVVAIAAEMLAGLFAAHEARDEMGESLDIVHRDVSPQNVIVGVDGIARLLDFGVAKATLNVHVTRAGTFKGKLAYTSPEQLRGVVTHLTDLYAAGVVIWEALAGQRMHAGRGEAEICAAVAAGKVPALTEVIEEAGVGDDRWAELVRLAPVVARGTAFKLEDRWPTARAMAEALVAAAPAATAAEVSRWVKQLGRAYLEGREKLIVTEESTWRQRASALPEGAPEAVEPASSTAAEGTLRPSALPLLAPPARGDRAIIAALVVVGGLLAAIVVLLVHPPREAAVVAAAPPVATPAATAAPSLPPPPLLPPAPTAPAVSPDAGGASAPHAVVPPRPRASLLPPPLLAPPSAPRAAPLSPPASPTVDCNPPFYFDGKKKVFKSGCL